MIPYIHHDGDKSFISDQMENLPYRFRPIIAKRYSQIFKNESRYSANISLLNYVDKVDKNPLVRNALIIDDDGIVSKAQAIAKRIGIECQTLEQALKLASVRLKAKYLPDPDGLEIDDYSMQRLGCQLWWRRALRKQQRRAIEETGRDLNLVNVNDGIYSTDETANRRKQQRARNRAMLEEVKVVNELGDEFTLQELSDKSVSNPEIRRMELMTRIAGFEKYALENDHVAEFWTVTCPSKYHSALSKNGRVNKKFNGLTPRDGQQYLAKTWARVRAKYAREGIEVYGFRVAEPQHDGTPHWHLLLFMPQSQAKQAREIYREYALKEDSQERGAYQYRFDFKTMNSGGAAGYIAKYISKNIDGYGIEKDLFDNCAATSAERVDAWASTWGIRQFQQIGGASVTVWRELRRLTKDQVKSGGALEVAAVAADTGDWCGYLKAQKENPIKLVKAWNDSAGRYGEPVGDQIFGVELAGVAYVTRIHVWTICEKREEISAFQARSASWSPVNNCTEKFIEPEVLKEIDQSYTFKDTIKRIEKGNYAQQTNNTRRKFDRITY